MDQTKKSTLWDSLDNYQRRIPSSKNPPSERIDPNIEGSHLWVVIVKNWQHLHPLMQDVLYIWHQELTQLHGGVTEELDPQSTQALVNRFEELDAKLRAFEVERTNLEQELNIRDRDFQRLRSLTGKREKENIEVQQMLGKSFQEKIMLKQIELDEKEELIKTLEEKIRKLDAANSNTTSSTESEIIAGNITLPESLEKDEAIKQLKHHLEERSTLLKQVSDKLREINTKANKQKQKIAELEAENKRKDEKIKEIKGLLNL